MDKIKDVMNQVKGHTGGNNNAAPGATGAGGAGNQDYGDKGLAAAEKKFGMSQSAATNEKITDAGRNFYEKQSGKDIPDKYSN